MSDEHFLFNVFSMEHGGLISTDLHYEYIDWQEHSPRNVLLKQQQLTSNAIKLHCMSVLTIHLMLAVRPGLISFSN